MCILLPPWCQVELIIELCPVDCKHAYAEITANAIFSPRRAQPGDRRCAGLCLRCSLGRRAFTSRVTALLCAQSQLFVVCDVGIVTCSVACSGTHASREIRIVCVLSFIEPPIFYTFVSSIRRSERSIWSPMICYFVSRRCMNFSRKWYPHMVAFQVLESWCIQLTSTHRRQWLSYMVTDIRQYQ